MRDGLSLVNVTRREVADGLRDLARRQRDDRLNSADLEAAFTRRLNDNTYRIDLKVLLIDIFLGIGLCPSCFLCLQDFGKHIF